ncbi:MULTISPECIES: ABC transporter ATP-binding protein [unclassified Corynebacterium]|uniref:ABC transporter ATP-binding protein n=1 Tax=unclassified Corynebacterium TaxID=2624378 RepID=UPI0008A5ADBF|nr:MULTISPECIES: ABC transporter ATP-binding protein [unclassified Corynebacterium]OFK60267.1 multidrug ABC transporter ATP-binding protein [Corynebacterium sp. HMSC078A10]OFL57679.1 multidrug ABC transporter ATP-binding protein [Corynebacterium sp. HMSC065D07]
MTRPMHTAVKDPADVDQLAQHPVKFGRVAGLFAAHRGTLLVVVALIIATSGLTVVQPFLVRRTVDEAIPNHDTALLLWLVGGMLAITVVSQAIGVIQSFLSARVGHTIMHELRTQVFANLQRQSLQFFTNNRGGEIQSRLTNDIAAMRGMVTTTATSVASNLTMTVATLVAMVALSPTLSLLSLLVLPPAVWLTRRAAVLRRSLMEKNSQAQAELQQTISENLSVSGMRLATTLGAQERVYSSFSATSRSLIRLELESQLAGRWRMALTQIIFGVMPALIYLVAGLRPGITIGTLIAFSTLQTQIFRPITGLLNVGAQWVASMALFSRIFEYLDLEPELTETTQPAQLADASLTLHNVSYRYPGTDTDALSDVSLSIPAHTTTALVGHTGSGKSTVAALMARLADPTTGSVRLGGVDLRDIPPEQRAEVIGVVSQETYLIHCTVRENLLFAQPEASEEQMWAALHSARVDEVIAALPEGLDTLVGSRGYRFSGGEQQRLSLARTLLRRPQVLILDEATSALDNETERAIQEAVLGADATRLVIAHRLSTIRDADQIVVLDAGRVAERGTHAELLARDGAYAALLRAAKTTGDRS